MKHKADFTAEFRLLWIAALGIAIGGVCTVVAKILLWLIAFFTNLFYFQTDVINVFKSPDLNGLGILGQIEYVVQALGVLHSPAGNHLGWLAVLVPVVGGLIIGLMARYGSDRGHGIPEAIEAILIGRSRMSPKVAVLKPLSSAISIGSGGPFGAEGPIIMTGGAIGSIIAQVFHLSAAERKTLLVAGAAGGMSATFGSPVAAVLLAVELLLFEWKPRSLVPVALASAVAFLLRPYLHIQAQPGPLFSVTPHGILPVEALLSSCVVGLFAGLLALALTLAVYGFEDAFHRLPIHWMWWPAIGGLLIGIGGMFQPRALGVGYDVIEELLSGNIVLSIIVPLIIVKAVIWSGSLGSGTSGGVLAPLLIMGGALGALESSFLPGGDARLWPLVSMAAVLAGTLRCPLTGIVFALELTHDVNTMPALLLAGVVAYLFTVLVMKRSILTEKIARRGYHVSREYAVDPLELLTVGEVMATDVVAIPAALPVQDLLRKYFLNPDQRHQGYPVVDANGKLLGVVTRRDLLDDWMALALVGDLTDASSLDPVIITYDLLTREPITAHLEESCRTVAERMAQEGVGRLPVVSPEDPRKVIGIITRSDLLKPRARLVEEESKRERFIGMR